MADISLTRSAALYTEELLAHAREPHRCGLPEQPCVIGEASNRLCGDEVRVGLQIHGDRVDVFGFEADACAITIAAASMLGDVAVSQRVAQTVALADAFGEWLGIEEHDEAPPEIVLSSGFDAFGELKQRPSRRRCALLPFEALVAAIRAIEANRKHRDD